MATILKNEVSKKNPYYISKHRMLELRNFCLQYNEWKALLRNMDGYKSTGYLLVDAFAQTLGDSSVEKEVLKRNEYIHRCWLVETAANKTDPGLAPYILKGVTIPETYDVLLARHEIPVSRSTYYKAYRKFFYILDKIRG